jgi:hypothetical protein
MAASLREALEEAQAENSEAVAEPEITHDAPIEEDSTAEAPEPETEAAVEEPVSTEAADEKPAPATPTPYDNAPASWKGDAKEVWAALPEKARREVVRRERQIDRALQESSSARQVAEEFTSVASQYDGRLREWGTSPTAAFKTFMDADRSLSTGPMSSRASAIANIIKEYNIDIAALDNALSGAQPDPLHDVDARVQALVQQQLAPFQQRMQSEEQAKQQQVMTAIENMAGNPEFPYFEDVREEMADLIEISLRRGAVLSLKDAYNKVVGYTGRHSPQQAQDTARKAKAASVSVSGAPASVTNGGNPADLRGSILAALEGDRG